MAEGRDDLGPALPPRAAVHAQAVELQALAARAVEFSGPGPTADLGLAVRQLERMRAVLGPVTRGGLNEPMVMQGTTELDDSEIGGAIDG